METKVKKEPVTGVFYAIMKVQNPYSSGNRDVHFGWISNYQDGEMTRQDFGKMAKRAVVRFAERKFFDTIEGGGMVKIFTDREKFVKEYKKVVDSIPNFND